jgi:hypothetical protein
MKFKKTIYCSIKFSASNLEHEIKNINSFNIEFIGKNRNRRKSNLLP